MKGLPSSMLPTGLGRAPAPPPVLLFPPVPRVSPGWPAGAAFQLGHPSQRTQLMACGGLRGQAGPAEALPGREGATPERGPKAPTPACPRFGTGTTSPVPACQVHMEAQVGVP